MREVAQGVPQRVLKRGRSWSWSFCCPNVAHHHGYLQMQETRRQEQQPKIPNCRERKHAEQDRLDLHPLEWSDNGPERGAKRENGKIYSHSG